MQEGVIIIKEKEATRYDVLRRVLDGVISLKAAAEYMNVTYRHAKRLKKKAERDGIAGLVHGNRGRSPANKIAEEIREEVSRLSKESYSDYNDTHFSEELEKEGINLSRESVRAMRRGDNIAPKRKRRSTKHRKRRPRKTSAGLMMLWDGSPHRWFGKSRPACCLMVAMDDAEGNILAAHFCEHECSWAYLALLRQVVKRHGVPCSVYQDKHTALKRNDNYWSLEEELAGRQEPTQVGRALAELGIEPIFANSPQAKGRVEKLFETLQDRLVAEFRRNGITDIAAANAFLDDGYIERFNERFAVPAADDHRWRGLRPGMDLDRICSFRYDAKVANDNAIRFCGLVFDIAPGPKGRSYAGCHVELRQLLDGSWRVYHDNKLIATAASTEVGEPFRAKSRRRSRGAAKHCEWVYRVNRQQDEKLAASGQLPNTKFRRNPGRPVAAKRIA